MKGLSNSIQITSDSQFKFVLYFHFQLDPVSFEQLTWQKLLSNKLKSERAESLVVNFDFVR